MQISLVGHINFKIKVKSSISGTGQLAHAIYVLALSNALMDWELSDGLSGMPTLELCEEFMRRYWLQHYGRPL